MVRRSSISILLLLVVAATTAAHRQIPPTLHTQDGEEAFIPRPEVAKAMALGFDAVLADYYWVQAVLLAGGNSDPSFRGRQLGRLIDVVTTLDPWVGHPYRFAAVWLTRSLEDVRHANMLLERSFQYHPDEWRNRFYLGFNLFYYLDDKERAAELLYEATEMKGAPAYLPRLVARLRSDSSDLASAGLFLEEMVRTAPDEAARAQYQSALDEIQIEWRARALDRARDAYKELFGVDIEFVEQLVTGRRAVLAELPSAEPSSLPASLRRGSKWTLQEESGRIVSTYYDRRYEVHIDEFGLAERAKMRAVDEASAGSDEAPRDKSARPSPGRGKGVL